VSILFWTSLAAIIRWSQYRRRAPLKVVIASAVVLAVIWLAAAIYFF
jgi:hypothetical protein